MRRLYYLKVKTGLMSNKKITLSGEEVAIVMAHAAKRGMTFEEYIQEFAQQLQKQNKKQEK